MQDRLKFRAWDDKNKVYHYDDFVVTATGHIAKITSGGEICQTDMTYDKSLVLEQCTGLRDKNGKLIYEGDIVKRESHGLGDLFAEFNGVIEYTQGQYFSTNGAYLNSSPLFDEIATFEIIGNIRQNQELLEG